MIADIRQGLGVTRYHTQTRLRTETVGHHSANVCAILLRLERNCSRNLLIRALMHDVPEYYTGDVPAPAKWDSPELKRELDALEGRFIDKHFIPHPQLDESEELLLKTADMLDLLLSCIEEVRMGNSYAEKLVSTAKEYIMGLGLPTRYQQRVDLMIKEVVEYEYERER